ncbi:amidohydrolase family protein [Spiroplasma endosymbiont of Stenodema calcarata]|uniref:amidohydrolase family protein n=1 Tax=Spiroplasma endosymbiont of Stenodema calcarata TaxID=3139328 RepID=UPI003CCAF9FB
MANTVPVIDHPQVLAPLLIKAKELPINIQFFSAITNNLAGSKVVDFASFGDNVIGFSDDGVYLANQTLLITALKYGQTNNKLIALHVDNRHQLGTATTILRDAAAIRFNLTGVNENYEAKPLAQDLTIVNQLQLPYHLCHLSTAKGVALIRKGKIINPFLTCEVTPHHLTLSIDDIQANDGNYLMNLPLNLKTDQISLIAALNDGTIDIIATDHAPHQSKEKGSFATSAMGIIGLQLTFPLLYTKLVQTKQVALATIINALTINPQKLIHHHDVRLKVANEANFTVIDLNLTQPVTRKLLQSKAANTPFLGTKLTGWPIINVHNGVIHYLHQEGT